jgi:hypothetical protein
MQLCRQRSEGRDRVKPRNLLTRQRTNDISQAMRKPTIPKEIELALERCSPETVRKILFEAHANPAGLPEEIRPIMHEQSPKRQSAIEWLDWKDAD